jgi:lysozyme
MNIISLIKYEEDWRPKPYLCSEGYPTVGFGFKIGPKNAPLSNYTFVLPLAAGESWLMSLLDSTENEMRRNSRIAPALLACEPFHARKAVLISMAYQMGVDGLAGFNNTLKNIASGRWNDAATGMLDSKWARQTPNRAQRHAEQMRTNIWAKEYS